MTAARRSGAAGGTVRGALGGALGGVLGAAFGGAAAVRRTKPLHPRGQVGDGVLTVSAAQPGYDVPLFAERGRHPCQVRWSRSVGLPSPLPDVEGLAVRFEHPRADLLFAATGTGRLTRFVFAPRPPGRHGAQTTLLPVATAAGPLLLRVTPHAGPDHPPRRYDLAVGAPSGAWTPVGGLEVGEWRADEPTRFDPVQHPLPGTWQYPAVRRMREPAYALARRATRART